MARILVLGGNGFIGKSLVHKLACEGEAVISFDLTVPVRKEQNVTYVCGDFFDETILNQYTDNVDIIYHGICTINPGNSVDQYMRGYSKDFIQTIKLCEIVKQKNIRMIFLSSGGTVYGKQKNMPISEECCTSPINHYGNLKVCIENTIKIFNQQNGTNIKIARVANPYGPGQDYEKGVGFIDAVLKRGLSHERIEIWGDGNVVRDYIYIGDVVSMLYQLGQYDGQEEIFNISTAKGSSQKEIIELAKKWIPHLDITYLPSRGVDVPEIVLDNTKILSIYKEKVLNLDEGVERYYNYLMSGEE